MKIVCVSASNVRHAGESSTSLAACRLIGHIAKSMVEEVDLDIITLAKQEIASCTGCGACFKTGLCTASDDFNGLYSRLVVADCVFIVSAHYAPIPSKLCALLEKTEQLAFLRRFHDENDRSPLYGMPTGIIGHGGGTEEVMSCYFQPVVDSIWNAVSWPVEMDVATIDGRHGVVFAVKEVIKREDSVFPEQRYDWEDVEKRIHPLVCIVLGKVLLKKAHENELF